jgi:hypothetical protein
MSHDNIGCQHSLIPDIKPPLRLATLRLDGFPQYRLLVDTVRATFSACGKFPAFLRRGDYVESLVDEAVSLGAPLLGKTDDDIRAGAKSIARRIIHREKHETRWWETDETGRRVRKSSAVMRIAHPVQRHGDHNADSIWGVDGDLEWSDPADTVEVDADGHLVEDARRNVNEVEARLIARLDRLRLRFHVINAIGRENYRWVVEYIDRKRAGVPIPSADRDRFRNLKKRVTVPRNAA